MIGNRQIRRSALALLAACTLGIANPVSAQILGGVKGLPGSLPNVLSNGPPNALSDGRLRDGLASALPLGEAERLTGELAQAPLADLRRLTGQRLLRAQSEIVEADDSGRPVVRGQVLAISLDDSTVSRLRQAGFKVRDREDLDSLGLRAFVLAPPRGLSAIEAVRRLRILDPTGQYDFNHLYQEGGAVGGTTSSVTAPASPLGGDGRGQRIGLVDGSVAQGEPAFAKARLVQRAFGPGGALATAHATAVASLIVGSAGRFRGAAPGASLYVADVYGPTPAGGSADAVVRALAWLAQSNTTVISISLVGPHNLLLKAAVEALITRGRLVVAAVGNDGPAAPPLYPAAYPGVVSVTGVDAAQRVLPEASRGTHVDFAAPGADMAAAGGGGYVAVRGTSFATPIVAGLLARVMASAPQTQALDLLGRTAIDLGAPGPDPAYGRGLVGADLRIAPAAVGASQTVIGKYLKPPG